MVLLDYQTPQPPRRGERLMPLVRFGLGSGGGFFVFSISYAKLLVGGMNVDVAVYGGLIIGSVLSSLLALVRYIRERRFGATLNERSKALSIMTGLGVIAVGIASNCLGDVGPAQSDVIIGFMLLTPVPCSWIIFSFGEVTGG